MHPIIVAPGAPGFADPFAAPFSSRSRKRVVIGLDSLGGSGGQPGLADRLQTDFSARTGDAGLGLIPLDNTVVAHRLAGGDYAVSAGFTHVSTLPWTDPRRRRSLFGKGIFCRNDATDDSAASDYLLLSGPALDVKSIDLYFEWSKVGQSFRVRQWPTEVLANGLYIRQEDHPEIGVVHKLTLLLDVGGVYAGKGINIEQVTCCNSELYFWAIEPHGPAMGQDGVQVLDLGTGSAGARDWAGLDDACTRRWVEILQADVFILIAGVNDRGAAPQTDLEARRNAAGFALDIDRIVDRLQSCSRTRLLLVRPPDPVDAAATALRYHDEVLKAAAWSRGCAWFDERDTLGDFAAADAAGFMLEDGVHPSASGNARRAGAFVEKLSGFLR